jgi:hypothetical protein
MASDILVNVIREVEILNRPNLWYDSSTSAYGGASWN